MTQQKNSYLFYAMRGEKMCFVHVLLNALALHQAGHTVRIILEGQAVTLPRQLVQEQNALYQQAVEQGLFAGVCQACSKQLGELEYNSALPYPLLADMNGHAGMQAYANGGFAILVM